MLGAKVGGRSLRTFWASQKAALGQRPVAGWALRLVTQSWEGPGRVKLSLFTDDMVVYVENLKEVTKIFRNY